MQFKSLGTKVGLVIAALALGFVGGVGFYRISRAIGYDLSGESAALAEASQTLNDSPIRVLYLTASEVPELLSLAEAEGVVVSSDARFAQQVDSISPLDVLMFDSARKNELDQAWVQQRYSQGMAVVGVNIGVVQLADFVGDRNLASSWSMTAIPDGDFYSMLQLYVTGDNPEEVERWKRESPDLLNEDGTYASMEGVTSHLSISGTRAQVSISDSQSLALMFRNIRLSTKDATP